VSRAGLASLLLFLAIAAFLVYQTLNVASATCEVCMAYRGQQQCRTVSAADEKEALQGGIINACAFISSGVTDSMACQRGEPVSKKCY
jgi:hypothetical protein